MIGRWCPLAGSHLSLSLRARVCHPNTRTYVRLLGPCFKTGRWRPFRPRDGNREAPAPERDGREGVSHASTLPLPRPSAAPRNDENPRPRTKHASVEARKMRGRNTARNGFPFSDFRYSLTLFSKFFASFPHGTCSLSVSRQYLALEGIYLLL